MPGESSCQSTVAAAAEVAGPAVAVAAVEAPAHGWAPGWTVVPRDWAAGAPVPDGGTAAETSDSDDSARSTSGRNSPETRLGVGVTDCDAADGAAGSGSAVGRQLIHLHMLT